MPEDMDLASWQTVPAKVAELLPQAVRAKVAHVAAAESAYLLGTSFATWRPDTNTVTVYAPRVPTESVQAKYAAAMDAWTCEFKAYAAPDLSVEILIKRAALPVIAPAFDAAQTALGGPTPLTNALVTGLAAGGLGYGTGALVENLFPERYLERGKLRRTLALLGAAGGLGLGINNASVNARAHDKGFWEGWTIKNSQFPYVPPENPMIPGNSGLMAPSVPIQQFNNAVWNDARKGFYNGFQNHTPPAYAAAASGLMTGLGTGLQSPIIRPADVINGIASAGVGLATATVAGKALSALAGLTPVAQEKLQDMGLWGGMMHAIVPAMLGIR